MASRGSYSKSYIGKGGGGKQLGGGIKPIKSSTVTAPKARPQKIGAMPRAKGYFQSGHVF